MEADVVAQPAGQAGHGDHDEGMGGVGEAAVRPPAAVDHPEPTAAWVDSVGDLMNRPPAPFHRVHLVGVGAFIRREAGVQLEQGRQSAEEQHKAEDVGPKWGAYGAPNRGEPEPGSRCRERLGPDRQTNSLIPLFKSAISSRSRAAYSNRRSVAASRISSSKVRMRRPSSSCGSSAKSLRTLSRLRLRRSLPGAGAVLSGRISDRMSETALRIVCGGVPFFSLYASCGAR